MDGGIPTADDIWRALIAVVPVGFRPLVGIGATVFAAVWLGAKFLHTVLDAIEKIRFLLRPKRPPPAIPPAAPPAGQKIAWLSRPGSNPSPPRFGPDGGFPIISVSNMKGGVGKTTLTANLAAHYDRQGYSVLLIDFDFQGSLSQAALSAAGMAEIPSVADHLIEGDLTPTELLLRARLLEPTLPNSRIFTCYYEFSNTETNVLAEWMNGAREEVRFSLSSFLNTPQVQEEYDVVLIDTGPRFTTSTINALCASTHILIPTILDAMSARSVGYYSKEIARHHSLFPNLRLLGVVPTMIDNDPRGRPHPQFTGVETQALGSLHEQVCQAWGTRYESAVLEDGRIPDRTEISRISGQGIAYLEEGNDAVRVFDRLGSILTARLRDEGFRFSPRAR